MTFLSQSGNAADWFCISPPVRFKVLSNNHLQIRGIKKSDEGGYTCEGRIMARGEIDLRVIKVIVNGKTSIHMYGMRIWKPGLTTLIHFRRWEVGGGL